MILINLSVYQIDNRNYALYTVNRKGLAQLEQNESKFLQNPKVRIYYNV